MTGFVTTTDIQRDRLRLALESGGIGTWDWDLQNGRLTWDSRIHDLYGLKPGEFSGAYEDFLSLLHPDDRGLLAEQLMRIGESRGADAHEVEYRVQLPNGEERFLADRSEALLGSDGQIERMIGVTWDITKRKQAEKALDDAHQKVEAANHRMKRDLVAAARIQQSLLPDQDIALKQVKTAWLYKPCEELAGDALNIFSVGENQLVVYVLDVCGHGVSSSLLAVSVSRNLSVLDGTVILDVDAASGKRTLVNPAEVASRLNKLYPMDFNSRLYFTLLYGVLDVDTGEFNYVCAGNPGPVHVKHNGDIMICDAPAVPIGLFPDSVYDVSTLELEPGDRLYLCTDGVNEEQNEEQEPFGRERVSRVLNSDRDKPLASTLKSIVETLSTWRGASTFSDDIAMLAVEVSVESDGG